MPLSPLKRHQISDQILKILLAEMFGIVRVHLRPITGHNVTARIGDTLTQVFFRAHALDPRCGNFPDSGEIWTQSEPGLILCYEMTGRAGWGLVDALCKDLPAVVGVPYRCRR